MTIPGTGRHPAPRALLGAAVLLLADSIAEMAGPAPGADPLPDR